MSDTVKDAVFEAVREWLEAHPTEVSDYLAHECEPLHKATKIMLDAGLLTETRNVPVVLTQKSGYITSEGWYAKCVFHEDYVGHGATPEEARLDLQARLSKATFIEDVESFVSSYPDEWEIEGRRHRLFDQWSNGARETVPVLVRKGWGDGDVDGLSNDGHLTPTALLAIMERFPEYQITISAYYREPVQLWTKKWYWPWGPWLLAAIEDAVGEREVEWFVDYHYDADGEELGTVRMEV